ncbi:MAG: hypothetical protein V9E94_14605 [Microthrixaceae bacterium]
MADVEILAANQRLAGLDEVDGMPTRYLGQYVIAKLAAKTGALVRLQPTAGGRGITAVVSLPASATVGGADRSSIARPLPGSLAARDQGAERIAPGAGLTARVAQPETVIDPDADPFAEEVPTREELAPADPWIGESSSPESEECGNLGGVGSIARRPTPTPTRRCRSDRRPSISATQRGLLHRHQLPRRRRRLRGSPRGRDRRAERAVVRRRRHLRTPPRNPGRRHASASTRQPSTPLPSTRRRSGRSPTEPTERPAPTPRSSLPGSSPPSCWPPRRPRHRTRSRTRGAGQACPIHRRTGSQPVLGAPPVVPTDPWAHPSQARGQLHPQPEAAMFQPEAPRFGPDAGLPDSGLGSGLGGGLTRRVPGASLQESPLARPVPEAPVAQERSADGVRSMLSTFPGWTEPWSGRSRPGHRRAPVRHVRQRERHRGAGTGGSP